MQNSNFDRSKDFSHESLSCGYETKKRKFEVVKQILPHNDISSCTCTSDPEFVISCKESFITRNNIFNTGKNYFINQIFFHLRVTNLFFFTLKSYNKITHIN